MQTLQTMHAMAFNGGRGYQCLKPLARKSGSL